MVPLRVVFMGTADLSCNSLQALLDSPLVKVVAVATQPDRPKGRDLKLHPSPVKVLGDRAGLPSLQPERARQPDFLEALQKLAPDLIVVAAYGQILPKSILELPPHGCINVHTSLLPRYRGAAPIQWALINGETETGVTIMKMDAGLDTGDILTQESTPVRGQDNAETLHNRLAELGASLLLRTIPEYVSGRVRPLPQPAEGASYAPKIKKEDGRIDWTKPARTLWNRWRGLMPWPGLFTFLPAQPRPHLLKVWQAAVVEGKGCPGQVLKADKTGLVVGCGSEALWIGEVQLEGGRRMNIQEFLAGHPVHPGLQFSP